MNDTTKEKHDYEQSIDYHQQSFSVCEYRDLNKVI